ncbi:MAG TPA: hypothetical protein VFR09_01600 [Alphaproteobacteria bacterium]|nr:hypothetical protein [Alphaproteobacteria bacterium]
MNNDAPQRPVYPGVTDEAGRPSDGIEWAIDDAGRYVQPVSKLAPQNQPVLKPKGFE